MLLRLRPKLGTALRWSDFAKPRRRPHSPNSAKPKCPWAGPRFRSKTRTANWPTFASNCSTGCIPMQAPVLGRWCPPNSCSTTRIDPRDPLRPLRLLRLLRRLRRLRPWSPRSPFRLVQLHLDHPAHLLVPADLQDPPPNWNSSKWFYWLNIPNTMTTTMTPFAIYM